MELGFRHAGSQVKKEDKKSVSNSYLRHKNRILIEARTHRVWMHVWEPEMNSLYTQKSILRKCFIRIGKKLTSMDVANHLTGRINGQVENGLNDSHPLPARIYPTRALDNTTDQIFPKKLVSLSDRLILMIYGLKIIKRLFGEKIVWFFSVFQLSI